MSLLLGKAVYSILSGSTEIKAYINNKIYPIFAPDETLNPFIVYDCRTIGTTYTKDGLAYDDDEVIINVISDSYSECLNISNIVRNLLELNVGEYNGINFYRSLVSNFTTTYGIDGYISTLIFTINSKDIVVEPTTTTTTTTPI